MIQDPGGPVQANHARTTHARASLRHLLDQPHQTARPSVRAKKRECEILATTINEIPLRPHSYPAYYLHQQGDLDQDPRLVIS